jgi:competence protein ComEA
LGTPPAETPVVVQQGSAAVSEPAETTAVTVHVAGAVHSPGLVTLRPGDRVAHAVAAAGGALAVADLSALNLAAVVVDGEQLTVPIRGEPEPLPTRSGDRGDGLVDVNHGSVSDLEALPGVGPVLAERIFAYRAEHGPFRAVEDLLDVPGIGEAKLAALREALILR